MQEVAFRFENTGHLENSYIVIHSFFNVIHTVSFVPKAKVNHVIPCLSIMWKSRGSFFIKHLIFILSFPVCF